MPARNSVKLLTRRQNESHGGPRRARASPPADREARALRGPPWFSFCLRVKSFLCCGRARQRQVPIGCRSQRRHSQISTFLVRHACCSSISLRQMCRPRSLMSSIYRVAPAHREQRRLRVLHPARQHRQRRQTPANGTFPLGPKGERSMHQFATPPVPSRAASAPPASPPAPAAQRHPDRWQNPMHLSRGSALHHLRWATPSAQRGAGPLPPRGQRVCPLIPGGAVSRRRKRDDDETPGLGRTPPSLPDPTTTRTGRRKPRHARLSSHGSPSRQSGNETFVRRTAWWSRWRDRGPGGAWRQPHRPGSAPPTMPATAMRHDCCHQLDHVATCFRISRGNCSRLPSIPVSGRRELANAAQQNPSCVRVTIVAEPGIEPVCQ